MENHQKHFQLARKEIDLADHLLYVTYPVVKDSKFLLSITEHIINASRLALRSFLEFERYYKRIDPYLQKFEMELQIFKETLIPQYNFNEKYYRLLKKLKELDTYNKESVMRFKRGDAYILAKHNYKMKTLKIDIVKLYLKLTKEFIDLIEDTMKKEPRVFNQERPEKPRFSLGFR